MNSVFLLFSALLVLNNGTPIFPPTMDDYAPFRYRDSIFQGVEVSTHTYVVEDGESLGFEFYEPSGDTEARRPVILYVHGGGFSNGSRGGEGLKAWAAYLTHRGYTVASMSYRLTMKGKSFHCDQAAENKIQTFQMSADDIGSCTKYLLEQATRLRIDPEKVILAGSSAGAEAILHAGYIGPDNNTLPSGFSFGGMVSMAGAMIDTLRITKANAIPIQMYHGTCDNLVPYGTAAHHFCPDDTPGALLLHGASSIAERYRTLGNSYQLITVCQGGHEWAGRPMSHEKAQTIDFLYNDVMLGLRRQLHYQQQRGDACDFSEQPAICEN